MRDEDIVVFTGVSGSGKSSIVFDTVAAESQRQMNETYSAWVRGRLPKYEKPNAELIDNLNSSVIIDQSRLGGNARSTVGTISDMYSLLRLLFSRIGTPSVGPASYFSFNNPNGMCPTCAGIGKIVDLDITNVIESEKTYDEGFFNLPAFRKGNYYWKVYRRPEYFRTDVKWCDLTEEEQNILLYGSKTKGGERQRVKLAQNIKKKGNIYILDEPTTGLHIADIEKVVDILESFVDRGNTVIVIEHNTDVMKLADYIIDIGPDGGTKGGQVVFTGTPREMIDSGETITARYLRR